MIRTASVVGGVLVIAATFFLWACHSNEPGPMEKAGARADEIGENISEGKNPLHKKGPLEEAGDAVDDAFDNEDD